MVWKTVFNASSLPFYLVIGQDDLDKVPESSNPQILMRFLPVFREIREEQKAKSWAGHTQSEIPAVSLTHCVFLICKGLVKHSCFFPSWLWKPKMLNPWVLIPESNVGHIMSFGLPRNNHTVYPQNWAVPSQVKFYASLTQILPEIRYCSSWICFIASPLPPASENCVSCYIKEFL